MKNLRFLLVAVCISAGVAAFSHVKASSTERLPRCEPFPDEVCYGKVGDGPIGWYIDYHQE